MKKITLFLLVFSTLIIYFGCGDQSTVPPTSSDANAVESDNPWTKIIGSDAMAPNFIPPQKDGVPPVRYFNVYLYERVKLYYHPFHNYPAGMYDRLMATLSLTSVDGQEYSITNISAPSDGTVGVNGIAYHYWHDGSSDCKYFYNLTGSWPFGQPPSTVSYYIYENGTVGARSWQLNGSNGGSWTYNGDVITNLPAPGSNTILDKFAGKWQLQ